MVRKFGHVALLLVFACIVGLTFQNCSRFDLQTFAGNPSTDQPLSTDSAGAGLGNCESENPAPSGLIGLDVMSPKPYQVFQRGQSGTGPVQIAGVVSSAVDCIEVQFQLRPSGGKSPWIRLTKNSLGSGESFEIVIGTQMGSYEIYVRAVKDKLYGASYKIQPVGVGDIFVVAGQSNSSFAGDTPLETSTDDMVSFFDGTEWIRCRDSRFEPSVGSNLSEMGRIDPYGAAGNLGSPGSGRQGGSPWCPFGDALYDEWKVPIAIVPTGISGTNIFKWMAHTNPFVQNLPPYPSFSSTFEWSKTLSLDLSKNGYNVNFASASIAGADGYYNFDNDVVNNSFIEAPPTGGPWVIENDRSGLCSGSFTLSNGVKYNSCMRAGFPYARLIARLKYFAEQGGVKAVLWHQGESDSVYQHSMSWPAMDPDYYSKSLGTLIEDSRFKSGLSQLPWFVSKVGVTLSQWKPGFDAGNSTLPSGSAGIFFPNTVPSNQDVNLLRVQQQKVIDSISFVFAGVDTDVLVGQSADGREVFRSEISFPHFSEHGLRVLADRWKDSVIKAFPQDESSRK